MSWFGDFFMTRAIANAFGFKGLERDVFFSLNYLNHQKKPKKRIVNKKCEIKESTDEKEYEPDLVVQCTNDTFIESIKCVSNYLSEKDNHYKTARIEVYKKVIIE